MQIYTNGYVKILLKEMVMGTIAVAYFSAVESIKKLREANFTEEQAEIVIELIEQQSQIIHEHSNKLNHLENKELATKGDLRETELRLQKEIAIVNSNLQKEIVQVKSDLVKWVLGTGIGTILAIAGLLKFMLH